MCRAETLVTQSLFQPFPAPEPYPHRSLQAPCTACSLNTPGAASQLASLL